MIRFRVVDVGIGCECLRERGCVGGGHALAERQHGRAVRDRPLDLHVHRRLPDRARIRTCAAGDRRRPARQRALDHCVEPRPVVDGGHRTRGRQRLQLDDQVIDRRFGRRGLRGHLHGGLLRRARIAAGRRGRVRGIGRRGRRRGAGAGAGAALEEDGLLPSPPPPPPQPAKGRRAAADSMPASMRACAERASAKLKRLVLMLKLDPRR